MLYNCVILINRYIREQPLNKQGGRDIFLEPENFFRNTLEPRIFFRGIWSQYFFIFYFTNSTIVTFRQLSRTTLFLAGLGPVFFFLASSRTGKFFRKNPAPRPVYLMVPTLNCSTAHLSTSIQESGVVKGDPSKILSPGQWLFHQRIHSDSWLEPHTFLAVTRDTLVVKGRY